jgi:hypothetical protein
MNDGRFANEEALAAELRSALRMGPGGLHDHQRQRILDAAMGLTSPAGAARLQAAAARRAARLRPGPVMAAAACFGLLAVVALRWIPAGPGISLDAFAAAAEPRVFILQLRLGSSAGEPESGRLVARRAPGFVRTSEAHIAELAPNPQAGGYEEVRLALRQREALPELGSVPIDGLLNSFDFDYPTPGPGEPVSLSVQTGPCPWAPTHRLVHVGLKARSADGSPRLVARDLRLVLDFNPSRVAAFRLVGNRGAVPAAGADPSGTTLVAGDVATVLYEIIPVGAEPVAAAGGWTTAGDGDGSHDGQLLAAQVRYQVPGRLTRSDQQVLVGDEPLPWEAMPEDFRFAAAVAACGLLLERAPGLGGLRFHDVHRLAATAVGHDPDGRRAEFLGLVKQAARIAGES